MPTYAAIVIDVTAPDQPVLAVLDVPAWQWAGDYWPDLACRCPLRVAVGDGARSSNRLHLDPLTPADRCGDQSPDGRGRAWLDSGGSPLAYGRCARGGCPLALHGRWVHQTDDEPTHQIASVVQREDARFVSALRGFDSLHWLQTNAAWKGTRSKRLMGQDSPM